MRTSTRPREGVAGLQEFIPFDSFIKHIDNVHVTRVSSEAYLYLGGYTGSCSLGAENVRRSTEVAPPTHLRRIHIIVRLELNTRIEMA